MAPDAYSFWRVEMVTATPSLSCEFEGLWQQSEMRRRLDDYLQGFDATPACCHAAALVASELYTNAVEHGRVSHLRVDCWVDDAVHVTVTHAAQNRLDLDGERAMPPPSSERGRGLAIVRELADEVSSDFDIDEQQISVTIPLDQMY